MVVRNLFLILCCVVAVVFQGKASRTDTVRIFSEAMQKEIPALVITPGELAIGRRFPVVYILHGYGGSYKQGWITQVKNLRDYAEKYEMILVLPDGGASWYFDSPVDSSYRYETFVSEELVRYIDKHYPTVRDRRGRAVTGNSMGGHGALFLAFRHTDVFGAAGATSGGVDIRPFSERWEIAKRLGAYSEYSERWDAHTVIEQTRHLIPGAQAIIFDCGTEDFFYRVNCDLHERLSALHIPHEFISRPGAHHWKYWKDAIRNHFQYFDDYFSVQGVKGMAMPVMGWSSWNTYQVNISEELIRSQADAMVEKGLKAAGYQYVNIDDGYCGGRDESGMLLSHPERFPRGLRVVSDYIHALGLKAGIYSDAGANTCGSIYNGEKTGIGIGFYQHEFQDAKRFFDDWNFDFIKIDYCGGQVLKLDEKERYTMIREAIDAVGRKDITLNICRWAYPGTWAEQVAQSWRISHDIVPKWSSVKYIVAKNLYLSAFARNGRYNDMDMLEIGRGLSEDEEYTHFGLWCIMSSPLLAGCDLTTIPPASLALLTNPELVALNQDPLGLQAYVAKYDGKGYVLVKDLEEKRGKVRAVAFYNPTDEKIKMHIDFRDLELGGKVSVRDVIHRKEKGVYRQELRQEIPAHGTCIFRLEAENRYEPELYEAEWAYLKRYTDWEKEYAAKHGHLKNASGQVVVKYLGHHPENYAEWENVYSEGGGEYILDLFYVAGEDRRLTLTVNGKEVETVSLNSGSWEQPGRHSFTVSLQPGYNCIRMGNPTGWAPDLDCFILKRK